MNFTLRLTYIDEKLFENMTSLVSFAQHKNPIKKKKMKQTEDEEVNCETKKCSTNKTCTSINGLKCMLI